MKLLAPYLKALTPFLLSIVGGIISAISAGGVNSLTWKIVLGGAIAGAATFLVPNKKPA